MKMRFDQLQIGEVFRIGNTEYRKTEAVIAPKRGYLITNAINLKTNKKTRVHPHHIIEIRFV